MSKILSLSPIWITLIICLTLAAIAIINRNRIWLSIKIACEFNKLDQVSQKRFKTLKNSTLRSQEDTDELRILEENSEAVLLKKCEEYFSELLLPSVKVPRIDDLINKINRCTGFGDKESTRLGNSEELSREVFQLFSYLDSSIAQEDNLLSQRLNLFLVAQTFLIAGYIQSFTLPSSIVFILFTFPVFKLLATGIAAIGCWTSFVSHASVRLSIQAIEYYQDYYQQLKTEFSKSSYDPDSRPFKHRVSLYFRYYPDIYFDQKQKAKGLAKYFANWLNLITFFFIFVWLSLFVLTFFVNIQPPEKPMFFI